MYVDYGLWLMGYGLLYFEHYYVANKYLCMIVFMSSR